MFLPLISVFCFIRFWLVARFPALTFRQPSMHVNISWRCPVGHLSSQLDAISEAFGWKLDSEDYKQVDKILAATIKDPVGPEFMAPPSRTP